MRRGFDTCPFCGFGWAHEDGERRGFTSIEFSYANNEVRLWNGTRVVHRHVGIGLPDPQRLAIGPEGGSLRLVGGHG